MNAPKLAYFDFDGGRAKSHAWRLQSAAFRSLTTAFPSLPGRIGSRIRRLARCPCLRSMAGRSPIQLHQSLREARRPERSAWLWNGVRYGLALALVSWSFTTLAVAAKNVMTFVPTYMVLETGFTLVQFAVVGPLIALAYRTEGALQP